MSTWIPCRDHNPEEPGRYLVTHRTLGALEVDFKDWTGFRWAVHSFTKVIAWQVPEPYREENEDETY